MPCYYPRSRGSYDLLVAAIIIVVASKLADGLCRHDERDALLRLKKGFVFDHALSELSSWQASSESDCCTWQGIACGDACTPDAQVVVSLDLADLTISGNLSSDLFALTSLRFLSLANNDFLGIQLPSDGFERLGSLTYLNLSYCGFVGQVPSSIARLPNLETLHLAGAFTWDTVHNQATPFLELKEHTLDTLITNLSSLQRLYIDYVNISVSDANNSSSRHSLRELKLSYCWFSGPIASSLVPKLRSLSKLILENCIFSHPMMNSFTGFEKLSSLLILSLSNSGLMGTFPSSRIFSIKTLKVLDLSGNTMLHGELPEFTPGSDLQSLLLSGTMFSRNIPESITNLHNLVKLDLSSCRFYGALPSFAQWTMIQEVDLSNNNLVGSLPSDGYSALHNLTRINLSNNSLSGENNLQGQIPELLSKLSGLTRLDLSSNNLTGTMDLSLLKNLTNLSLLQLSCNRLSVLQKGDARSYVGYPNIVSLGLASCNLTKLPAFLMYQNEVESLDLSDNSIAGPIPDWIWKGLDLTLVRILYTFKSFDVSNNSFDGTIPSEIGDLKLLKVLNLSRNAFVDRIPSQMSSMVQQESLDLSHNYLSGEIPSGLASLTFLEVLDLSYNYLYGPVPQSGQFLTFPNTSYEGNSGLCGSPLSRQCHRPESRIRDDGDNDSANWDVLSVELGVACGLAAITGYLLLSSRGRWWFTTHIDSLLLHVHHCYHRF
ncbi:hypothetical protein C2845_PM07G25550 [Panicum miliaceum]|uniref:Leucine-rich repeat-containing N-terminal plant-type domain-containing protein n=1 Tax=Panicum miliaceum TaxID=4540 RepID=A0A3L6SPL2_PANMI|nr:hypothetical protein C2845_PM07G25550 [Panicum miliaceum]